MRLPIIEAEWLRQEQTQAVFAALEPTGEVCVVGGAVRNALMGHAITDIDLATTARPDATRDAARAAGLTTVDTGLAHGTITVISGGTPYEVTTLRQDVSTDGRHADVAFTTDWAIDASRRDFTINALYCDRHGQVFDPLGGVADLRAGRVRFIGDARARIGEDYLRILRFFRFSATYAFGALDPDGLSACGIMRSGLLGLSAERIRTELLKLMAAPRAADVIRVMHIHGYWPALLGLAAMPEHAAAAVLLTNDPLTRLAALAVVTPEHARALAARLRLSKAERDLLVAAGEIGMGVFDPFEPATLRRSLYRYGRPALAAAAILAQARMTAAGARATDWPAIRELIATWPVPTLPIAGRDLLAAGLPAGPDIGARLARSEAAWIASDFSLDADALLQLALA